MYIVLYSPLLLFMAHYDIVHNVLPKEAINIGTFIHFFNIFFLETFILFESLYKSFILQSMTDAKKLKNVTCFNKALFCVLLPELVNLFVIL